ncbi:hypothetical protein PHLGIDRAFT_19754 [Phlebiopsis gigantea 11061_1 CR5-6]|uniref:RlpA-like protein double-psi beta-barrel domain-containing protein n=1 Tax=Phlebiopsis gigantea (strain 11061_1 CR5-6) TaxID=745531 RepID=A0A0C3RVJ8_PHLG1|nr:hypothetical protein PHLGIDRAFT_19754 [Phlebiopsis gigantea 11061_1 CR5-6]
MSWSTITIIALLSATILCRAASLQVVDINGRRSDVARRSTNGVDVTVFTPAQFTFYDVGLGACGQRNVASDFVVALNIAQYGPKVSSPDCFKSITLSWGGKTTIATIVDECPSCPDLGLDLSQGLFEFFAPLSAGLLSDGEWWFND